MNEHGKSDRPVVPTKFPNSGRQPIPAEGMKGRGLAKGNLSQQNTERIQGRDKNVHSALERVRQAAERDKTMRFTSLMHHIYDLDTLRGAYNDLKRGAAPGVDGETRRHYGQTLEENLGICLDGLNAGLTEPSRYVEPISSRETDDKGPWESRPWRTNWSNGRPWRCSIKSTRRTFSGFRTGSDRGEASINVWMRSTRDC